MQKTNKGEVIANVLGFALYLYGVVLGFKAGFTTGLAFCFLVITPVITAIGHLVTGFNFNLAAWLTDFVNANPGVVGVAAIVSVVVISYVLLAGWFKIITMFARK